ncbi:MAG: hypothetical protein ACRDWA_07600 [Acidimicrobiia bacterium]
MAQRTVTMEEALAEAARAGAEVVAQAGKLAAAGKKAVKAAEGGDLKALRQALASLVDLGDRAGQAAVAAEEGWAFPSEDAEEVYLNNGYQQELLTVASEAQLGLYQLEGVLACFPSLVRIMPKERVVAIDRKPYRFIRPSHLVRHLKEIQTRPGKNNPTPFLESLYRAYAYSLASKKGSGRVASVAGIYRILTLLPIARKDYTQQEFARDLYLLEESGVQQTNSGATIRFHAATGTKSGNMLRVIGRNGRERLYSSIEFVEPS